MWNITLNHVKPDLSDYGFFVMTEPDGMEVLDRAKERFS